MATVTILKRATGKSHTETVDPTADSISVAGVVGNDDGNGVVIGNAGASASTGSALQAATFTTTERGNLVAANGMVVYNSTLEELQARINGAWVDVRSLINAEAAGTSTISTSSTTDVQATGMSLTEGTDFDGAGTYLAIFTGSVQHSAANSTIFTSIHVAGTQQAKTERRWGSGGFFAGTNIGGSFVSAGLISVTAGQAVTGEWRTSGATATMYQRSLVLVKLGA